MTYTNFAYLLIPSLFILGCNSGSEVKVDGKSNIGVISGTVEQGSGCGIQNSQTNQCQTKPLSVSIAITSLSGSVPVKTVKSNNKGLFQVSVALGKYRLKIEEPFFPPSSTIVSVVAGKESKVRLIVPTGVR